MRPFIIAVGLLGGILLLSACSAAEAPRSLPGARADAQRVVPGEYVLNARAGVGSEAIREAYMRYGVAEVRSLGGAQFLIRLTDDPGLAAVRRAALDSGTAESVSPNFVYRYQR